MDKKIIRAYRYNTVSRSERTNRQKKEQGKDCSVKRQRSKDVKYNKAKKSIEKSNFGLNIFKIVACIGILILIGFSSKYIVKLEDNPIIRVFSPKEVDSVKYMKDYYIKVGMNSIGNINMYENINILTNELLKLSKPSLISFDSNYKIEYVVSESINKISNLEYEIVLKSKINVTSQDVINSVNEIKKAKDKNIYYNNIKNISEITAKDNKKINVKLVSENPYFIYTLNFPIYTSSDFSNSNKLELNNSDSNNIKFVKNNNQKDINFNSLTLKNYSDLDNMVDEFRNGNLDIFLTSSYDTMQLIGKHEYSVKKYRNGETIFLLGNKNSEFFNKKEVRQALVYSLNREEILKNLNTPFAEMIDLPYIYSSIKYKYDTIGAENILLSNGWKKSNNSYSKQINNVNRVLELNFLVNESDSIKVAIAENIKQMLEKNGIRINILKLNEQDINKRIIENNYDIVLSTIYLTENPNISYIDKYVNINDTTKQAFEKVSQANSSDIYQSLIDLQNVLSEEVACIGIIAKNTNVVYQKDIVGIEDIGYMGVFKNIQKIGKIKK
ncbi:MAG: ABC transporter substrate-binding protein [Clostridia bacterium]|nr:ABC transporter substrate-binding protein [Clostridia bacterium]